LISRDDARLHRWVAWLQTDVVTLVVEALERRPAVFGYVVDDGHGDIAVVDALLRPNYHQVTIVDVVLDHRGPTYPQRIRAVGDGASGELDEVVRVLDCFDGLTRGDAPNDRDADDPRLRLALPALAT